MNISTDVVDRKGGYYVVAKIEGATIAEVGPFSDAGLALRVRTDSHKAMIDSLERARKQMAENLKNFVTPQSS